MFKLEDLPELAGNLSALRDAFEKYGEDLVPLVRHMIALDQGLVARALLVKIISTNLALQRLELIMIVSDTYTAETHEKHFMDNTKVAKSLV